MGFRQHAIRFAVTALTLLPLITGMAHADPDPHDAVQRRDLALIQAQLHRMQDIVDRLEARARRQEGRHRVYLDIPALRQDLRTVQAGIRDYLSPPRMPPRRPAPLTGDYLKTTTP